MDKIELRHIVGLEFDAKVEDCELSIKLDSSPKRCSQSSSIRPKPLILMALGGCTAMDVASLIEKMRVKIEGLTIDVSGEIGTTKPEVYTSFKVRYNFSIDGLPTIETKHKLLKIIEMSQERYCAVSAMVKKIAPLSYSATINGHRIESCACKL